MIRSPLGHIFLILLLLASCAKNENVIPKPSISISNESITDWNGCLNGHALGIDPDLYHISIYINIHGLWYIFPNDESAVIPITKENQWNCQAASTSYAEVKEIIIFLLPNTFNPPILDGVKNIPLNLSLVAAASYSCSIDQWH